MNTHASTHGKNNSKGMFLKIMLEVHRDNRYHHIFHIAMQPKAQTTSSAETESEYCFFF
jgi:hypothetical protein